MIAGKVIDAAGTQHRFAFVRNGQTASADEFEQALAAAGVRADTPATMLCDGEAGLWRLQRETLPAATVVLDWWHVAIRSSTRCRRHAVSVRVRRTQILPMTRFITWSVRNGACGTADGPGAGVNLLAYTAGRSASTYARSPASTVFNDTSANFSATLSATRHVGALCCPASTG